MQYCFRIASHDPDKPKSRLFGFERRQDADEWRAATVAAIARLPEQPPSAPGTPRKLSAALAAAASSHHASTRSSPPILQAPGLLGSGEQEPLSPAAAAGPRTGSGRRPPGHRTVRGDSFGTSVSSGTLDTECSWSQVSRATPGGMPEGGPAAAEGADRAAERPTTDSAAGGGVKAGPGSGRLGMSPVRRARLRRHGFSTCALHG